MEMLYDKMKTQDILLVALCIGGILFFTFGMSMIKPYFVKGEDCKLPGTDHKDNKPSQKKGDQLIKEGANVCELAKKCDAMEIKVKIDDKQELQQKPFYKNASPKEQKELTEYATKGKGHDSPNLVCYELIYVVNEK